MTDSFTAFDNLSPDWQRVVYQCHELTGAPLNDVINALNWDIQKGEPKYRVTSYAVTVRDKLHMDVRP